MPQIAQYYNVLLSKIKPSADIQRLGSQNRAIRSSSTFGPQMTQKNWSDWAHRQNDTLTKAMNRMNQ